MSDTMNDENFLTTSTAARLAGVSESLLRHAEKTGQLAVLKTTNGRRLFRQRDVLEYMKRRAEKNRSD